MDGDGRENTRKRVWGPRAEGGLGYQGWRGFGGIRVSIPTLHKSSPVLSGTTLININ